MGTKLKHPSPLSDVDRFAVAELLAEIAAKNGWTATTLFKELGGSLKRLEHNDQVKNAEFDPDLKTVKKLIDTKEPINDWHMWGFFLWLKNDYGKDLFKKQIGEQLKRKEQGIKHLRQMFGFWDPVNPEEMQAIQGSYKLFRPSHVNPTKNTLVSKFTIGATDNHFHCTLASTFNDSYGEKRNDFFRGHIIPVDTKLMAVMFDSVRNFDEPGERFAGRSVKGNLVIHFDAVDYSANDRAVQGLEGIALMSVGAGPASAWPIIARRDEGDFDPCELGRSEFLSLPEPIQDSLGRGAVHWNPRFFPTASNEPT